MLSVDLLVRAPLWMLRDKRILAADYFPFEVSGKTWEVLCQSCAVLVGHEPKSISLAHLLCADNRIKMTLSYPHA